MRQLAVCGLALFRRYIIGKWEYYQTATTEINLDHIEECEYCGNITNVVDRIYSHEIAGVDTGSFASNTNFDNARVTANERSRAGAGHKLATHINWHRCTNCGFYGSKALDMMKRGYSGYKVLRNRVRWILWATGIFFLLLDIPMIFSINTPEQADFAIIWTAITLILAFAGWVLGYNIRDGFEGRLAKVNNPDLIQRWLAEWHDKSSFFINNIYDDRDVSMHRASYQHLDKLQHLCDPIKPGWINSPAFKVGR